jgi:hypothetical protein
MQEISKGRLWTSYALSAIPVLLLLMAVAFDLLKTEMAVKGAADLGYPENTVRMLGGFALVTVVLYLIPRTSVLGAIFVACYFGGAVATHIRAGQGIGMALPAMLVCALAWIGLYLREPRLASLVPTRK